MILSDSWNGMLTPRLASSFKGFPQGLEEKILMEHASIENWFEKQWQKTPAPFYCSVDVRNAGFKIAVVDTNLFPAGFNNLNPDLLQIAVEAVKKTIGKTISPPSKILLIPENHTRNLFYFEHLAVLYSILEKAGYEVRIGSLLPQIQSPKKIPVHSHSSITLHPIQKQGQRLVAEGFDPDFIILNHDLSEGLPLLLQDVEQPIVPPVRLGWQNRLKSTHFQHYQNVCQDLAESIQIDPWLLSPLFRYCGEVDFMSEEGQDCLMRHSEALLAGIEQKYKAYGIQEKPFLVVKADAGTYGMAVRMFRTPEEIRNMNRKERQQMASAKGGKTVSKVIIQEGVPTIEKVDDAIAEPVVYMVGKHVIGGFYRVHKEKSATDNLNAPGANFKPLPFTGCCKLEEKDPRYYLYGVIARLGLVAAAREEATSL